MRLSILDGCLFCAMVGVAEQYLVPFAVSLGAGPGEVALLVGLPLLAGSLGQLWAPALVRRTGSRRQVVHALALLQATAWLPISLLAWRGPSALALAALIVAVVAYQAAGHFIGPIWTDWMGDLVPLDGRGRYFGRRNLWCGLVNVATFLGTGLALAALAPGGRGVTPAYAGLFLAGFFLRAGSALCLGAQAEPVPPRAGEALGAGVREALESLFRGAGVRGLKRGIALLVLMAFSVHVAVPFFTPYLLRELALSYGTYALVLGSGALA
ncbi:MAG: hypothetical protein HY722_01605, partial [Planctomycetes bacterium]|nr:hypothetical protein [Planctomycetota bacterium]